MKPNQLILNQNEISNLAKVGEDEAVSVIGRKGYGLTFLPIPWVPPFFCLTTHLYQLWESDQEAFFTNTQVQEVISAISTFNQNSGNRLILRSSAQQESLRERGKLESIVVYNNKELENAIVKIFEHFANAGLGGHIAIICQEFKSGLRRGHFSNERRISKTITTWRNEQFDKAGTLIESRSIQVKFSDSNQEESKLKFTSERQIQQQLRRVAQFAYRDGQRHHFEWVLSNRNMYIVQNDVETKFSSSDPGSLWTYKEKDFSSEKFSILKRESEEDIEWEKCWQAQKLNKLGLDKCTFYVLSNPDVIARINDAEFANSLEDDFKKLLQYPIVIRTTLKKGDNKQNLPRTDTVFNYETVKEFLRNTISNLKNLGINPGEYAFVIHHFIASKACALALARPYNNRVRIDSSWGLADGLSRNPHDTFEIDTQTGELFKNIRYKGEYLDVNERGSWIIRKSGAQWDWSESLSKNDLLAISKLSKEIATLLESEVIIMYFIGDGSSKLYPEVLPWYFSTKEIPDYQQDSLSEKYFFVNRETVRNYNDYVNLKNKFELKSTDQQTIISLELEADSIRNNDLITKVGDFAKKYSLSIFLSGSILSHTYYLLTSQGAHVMCASAFKIPSPSTSFNKLVRDKIPERIRQHGDVPTIQRVIADKNNFLNLLKQKAIEEAFELFNESSSSKVLEELADLYEVIRSISNVLELKENELDQLAEKKRNERGGFSEGILLKATNAGSPIKETEIRQITGRIDIEEKLKESGNQILVPLIPPISKASFLKPFYSKFLDKEIYFTHVAQYLKIEFVEPNPFGDDPNQLTLFPLPKK